MHLESICSETQFPELTQTPSVSPSHSSQRWKLLPTLSASLTGQAILFSAFVVHMNKERLKKKHVPPAIFIAALRNEKC